MGRGKTIFVVSPLYLEVIIKEAKKFMFDLQGYGSFELAKKGILSVNSSNILGFAFVSDSMPNPGSAEYNNMLEFLNLCNLMGKFKFVLVLRGPLSGKIAGKLKGFENLSFYLSNGFEYLTDSIINTNVFGSLLMTSTEPYKLKAEQKIALSSFECPTLKLVMPMSNYLLQCNSAISKLDTVEQTLEFDSVYQMYVKDKSVLADLREALIRSMFDESQTKRMIDVQHRFESLVASGSITPAYLAMCKVIADTCKEVCDGQ